MPNTPTSHTSQHVSTGRSQQRDEQLEPRSPTTHNTASLYDIGDNMEAPTDAPTEAPVEDIQQYDITEDTQLLSYDVVAPLEEDAERHEDVATRDEPPITATIPSVHYDEDNSEEERAGREPSVQDVEAGELQEPPSAINAYEVPPVRDYEEEKLDREAVVNISPVAQDVLQEVPSTAVIESRGRTRAPILARGSSKPRQPQDVHATLPPTPRQSHSDFSLSNGPPVRLIGDNLGEGRLDRKAGVINVPDAQATKGELPEPVPAADNESTGHTRAPVLVRRTSTSSTISRVQSLLPSSPQLPAFGLSHLTCSPPKISNVTVSGTGFNRPRARPPNEQMSPKEVRRRSTGLYGDRGPRMTPHSLDIDGSEDEGIILPAARQPQARYPANSNGRDRAIFSSFLSLSPSRRLLAIGYDTGVQIWDVSNLGSVHEVLNLRMAGAVVGCGVLPMPVGATDKDPYAERRPLIGLLIEDDTDSYLLVYSLSSHRAIKKLTFSGANVVAFQASQSFIVVSTAQPTALHVLSSRSLAVLHTIPSRHIAVFSRPVPIPVHSGTAAVTTVTYATRQDRPHSVFALSSRLIAFASRPSSTNVGTAQAPAQPHGATHRAAALQIGPLNVSHADVGNAALKVGGGILSGMKALGGLAAAAARGEAHERGISERGQALRNYFFSRSAPAAPGRHERQLSFGSSTQTPNEEHDDIAANHPDPNSRVTVLDLRSLLDEEMGTPEVITEFAALRGQAIAGLQFSNDGTSLAVVPSNGSKVQIYQMRPQSSAVRHAHRESRNRDAADELRSPSARDIGKVRGWVLSRDDNDPGSVPGKDASDSNVPWHLYDLRRGRTHGVIEAVHDCNDERWYAIGTRNRTIHVFATNPYGGKPDEVSHLEGRNRNVDALQPLSVELNALIRLRTKPASTPEQLSVPIAFTFLPSTSAGLPSNLRFSGPFQLGHGPTPGSVQSSPRRRTTSLSPRLPLRPGNFQDLLVFDPLDGSLSLRRLVLSARPAETSSLLSSLPLPGGTSISLPGMGIVGRVSASPPKPSTMSSGLTKMMEVSMELAADESTVATWPLLRDAKWKEVKTPVAAEESRYRPPSAKSEWSSQAELSTSSRSMNILPGSIYLSHQFTFLALGEDYHALLSRSYFDVPTTKIEVRKEVEASAFSTGHGESFIHGSAPQQIQQGRSFDESIASAISAGLYYSGTTPPVIPMFPNGAQARSAGSFRAAIPIRSVAAGLTDGVHEGFGRLRREIKKVRSPVLRPRAEENTPGPVPLEFDEEDEVFPSLDDNGSPERDTDTTSGRTSRGGADSGASVSTPSTNNNLPLAGSISSEGWGPEEVDAVQEAEQYDEISAAGFMDEDQLPIRIAAFKSARGRKGT